MASIKEINERYEEARGSLPAALHLSYGFLLGEAHDARVCGVTVLAFSSGGCPSQKERACFDTLRSNGGDVRFGEESAT
jgi:hypothetical protein